MTSMGIVPTIAGSSLTPPDRAATRPLFGLSSQAQDRFSSSRPGEASDAEKLAATIQEASELFSQAKTKNDLIALMKAKYADQCEIYDGSQSDQDWVNQVCTTDPAQAFRHVPYSVLYPNQYPPNKAKTFTNENGQYPAIYTDNVLPSLYRQKKQAIFISKDATRDVLMHEVFHFLQTKNGLASGTTPEADEKAQEFNNRYLQDTFPPASIFSLLNPYIRGAKVLFSWCVSVPILMLKRAVSKNKPQPNPDSPGEALRVNMAREQEADRFLVTQGGKFGLSILQRLKHLGHFIQESKLKELLSDRLD